MSKNLLAAAIFFVFVATSAYAQRGGNISNGDKLAVKVGRYTMATDNFKSSLNQLGGRFSATKTHLKIIKDWTPKLMSKLAKHRSKHEIQGPLNVVNIHHKLVLASFFREAKGKKATDIKQALLMMEKVMTNIRLGVVEQYGLHIAL